MLSAWVKALRQAGYHTAGVSTFEEAKRQLMLDPPNILITGARLGAYNGLHLVHLGRAESPRFQAVIIGEAPDAVLERDAIQAGAAFLVEPVSGAGLVAVVTVLVGGPTREGPNPRLGSEPRPDRRRDDRRATLTQWVLPERRVVQRRRPVMD